MQYYLQPPVKPRGVARERFWHTFRRSFTTLLTTKSREREMVRELLRHGRSKITMDVYAQARMEGKRRAQGAHREGPTNTARGQPERGASGADVEPELRQRGLIRSVKRGLGLATKTGRQNDEVVDSMRCSDGI